MTAIGLVILGAILGAAGTGGVQAWSSRQQRLLSRKVAARVILEDLYLTMTMLEVVVERHRWPDRLDLKAPLSTWSEFRAPFAAGVNVAEWTPVNRVYAVLHRLGLNIVLGQPCQADQMQIVDQLLRHLLPKAQRIVVMHAADTDGERERIAQEWERGQVSASPASADKGAGIP